ncbi:MAG: helix-turn-helix domain-containing protein [Bdellovibrionales bacterium]
MSLPDLGVYLKNARENRGLSQMQVAKVLKLKTGQSISDWERNRGSTIPVSALKKLIYLYELDVGEVFEVLLNHQLTRLEQKITEDFFGESLPPERKKGRL